jgi:NAD(P)-dependent dehydrogenase (short-subunit alcohol dehydrogenase family)
VTIGLLVPFSCVVKQQLKWIDFNKGDNMRIMVVGASGTIGSAVADLLGKKHDVIRASRNGEVKMDISEPQSIRAAFADVGQLDAVVSCAGDATFAALEQLTDDDLSFSIQNKLLGQVNLVRFGISKIRDKGSFTLTSGIFATNPWPGVPAIAMVNGAIESFGRAAALDLPRGIRLNVVSPPFIEETAAKMGMAGKGMITAADNAKAYAEFVEGTATGQICYTGT